MTSELLLRLQSDIAREAPIALDVDLTLPGRGITAVTGVSGSGKTSLLRAVAGLLPAKGRCSVNGAEWLSPGRGLPPHRRRVGYVFQGAALFPHLNVIRNLSYGASRWPHSLDRAAQHELIELLDIGHLLSRRPGTLSGGEQQRVAIARALFIRPDLLLMDEPLSALDAGRRREVLGYLERLRERLAIPVLYVTHSADEIARLADYLVILEAGRVQTSGPMPDSLLALPEKLTGADGPASVLTGSVVASASADLTTVAVGEQLLRLPGHALPEGQSQRVRIFARDVSITLEYPRQTSILNVLPARILEISASEDSPYTTLRLQVNGAQILSRISSHSACQLALEVGMSVFAQVKAVSLE